MTELFLQILNMSLSASWLVLAVVALRFLLKKAPKWVNVLLWGLVAFRLVCPFTLESALSLIPSAEVISPEIMTDATPTITTGIEAVNSYVNPILTETFAPEPAASANPLQIWIPIASILWCIGMALMLLYTAASYGRLRYRVRMAIRVKGNIYLSEYVDSPFVLGIFKPKIYLPYHMDEPDRTHVIAHERTHIRRRDHWWKPLGFLLLTVHWFNPVMWAAYILLCRDIELACDERVIKELGTDQRADYSQALLHCSVSHRSIAACPLAFGEVGVKERVKNVLSYKKPAFWVIVLCLVVVVIVSVCFLTDPLNDDLIQQVVEQDGYTIISQESKNINLVIQKAWLPEDCLTLDGHTFEEKEIVPYSAYADNVLYLKHVGYEDETKEHLTFTFDFVTESPEDGKLLLPYQVSTENGQITKTYNCDVLRNEVWDNKETYSDAAYLLIPDSGGSFCVNIRTEIYENAGHHIAFMLTDFNELTYEDGSPESADASDLPITMVLYDAFRTRAFLTFHYSGSLSDNGLQISEAYTLEQLVNGSWEELPRLSENPELHPVVEVDSANYDAWNSLSWEEDYGRLPDGTYRIKKDITLTTDAGSTETRPYYAEFTIGGTAEDYVTLKPEDITPTGATLYEQENVDDTMDLIYDAGEGYWLETLQDSQWTYLEPTSYVEPTFENEKRYIYALHYSSGHMELDWSHLYGELPAGTYRIAREVTYTGGAYPIVCTVYAEFAVGSDWGIDLFLDRISENGITVNFLMDDSLQAGEYFYAGSTLQVKERTVWTDVIPMTEPSDNRDIANGTACELIWDEELYQLTEGEHRVGIRIKHVLPNGTEEYNTLYEYFDPSSYAWGAALDVTSVSCTDQDVSIEYRQTFTKAPPEGSLSESAMFGLQRRENNQWVDFERTYSNSDLSDTGVINLSSYFGKLSNGTYRLVRYVIRRFSDGTTDTRPVYAIFATDTPVPLPNELSSCIVREGNEEMVTVSDPDTLESLRTLFASAKAVATGPDTDEMTLNLTLTGTGGSTVVILLDWHSDTCYINGQYYDYGPDENEDASEALFDLLQIGKADDLLLIVDATEHFLPPYMQSSGNVS